MEIENGKVGPISVINAEIRKNANINAKNVTV